MTVTASGKPFPLWRASQDDRTTRTCVLQRNADTGHFEVVEQEQGRIVRRAPVEDAAVALRVQRDWRVELADLGWQVE